jgi:glycolate oxidase iron-sulfur subunit
VQVSNGTAKIDDSYVEHMDLCLACRACESACPSGVPYGRLIEAARTQIANERPRPFVMRMAYKYLLPSRTNLKIVGTALWLYEKLGVQALVRATGLLPKRLAEAEALSPPIEKPFFFESYGKTFPAIGQRKYRVALLGGCIANLSFARLNDATVRVLQKNGCEVVVPDAQNCCGALQVHAGMRDEGRALAKQNIDAVVDKGFDAVICNAGGCGSTLKEYDELMEHDPAYAEKARKFVSLMKDVSEFIASIDFNREFKELPLTITYQDSCHLAHGQKVRGAPRKLLTSIPGVKLREMQNSDLCCGSAGVYNVVHTDLAMQVLDTKMNYVKAANAECIVTANPGCMLQLRYGAKKYETGQTVMHVVEVLDRAYGLSASE